MWSLVDAVERESVEQPGDKAGKRVAREAAHEQERTERREHERRQEQQVIGEQDVTGQGIDRCALQRLRDEQLGLSEGIRRRMEDVGMPPVGEGAEIAVQQAPGLMEVPGENPAVQQRITEIPGHVAGEPRGQRPRPGDGEERIEQRRVDGADPVQPPVPCRSGRAQGPVGVLPAVHAVRPARNSPVNSATRS